MAYTGDSELIYVLGTVALKK